MIACGTAKSMSASVSRQRCRKRDPPSVIEGNKLRTTGRSTKSFMRDAVTSAAFCLIQKLIGRMHHIGSRLPALGYGSNSGRNRQRDGRTLPAEIGGFDAA